MKIDKKQMLSLNSFSIKIKWHHAIFEVLEKMTKIRTKEDKTQICIKAEFLEMKELI